MGCAAGQTLSGEALSLVREDGETGRLLEAFGHGPGDRIMWERNNMRKELGVGATSPVHAT